MENAPIHSAATNLSVGSRGVRQSIDGEVRGGEKISVSDHHVRDIDRKFCDLFANIVEEYRAFPSADNHDGVC